MSHIHSIRTLLGIKDEPIIIQKENCLKTTRPLLLDTAGYPICIL